VPGLVEADCGGLLIVTPHDEGNLEKIAISPRDVYVSDILPPGPAVNRFQGVITGIDFNTTMARLNIKVGNVDIKAEMFNELAREMGLTTGREVYLILKLRRLKVLGDTESGASGRYENSY
jgi:molybdopterin-binding protein